MKSELVAKAPIRADAKAAPASGFSIGSIISHTLLIIVSLLVLFPFIWMLDTALKPNGQVYQFPPTLLPNPISLDNFVAVWTYLPFGHFLLNSLFVALTGTILVMITSSLAAYAFARLKFAGRDTIFFAYVATLLIPQAVLVIPEFLIIDSP